MKPYTRPELATTLQSAIPEYHAASAHATAALLESALAFILSDMQAMRDARKALLAATVHTPPGGNAETLCRSAIASLSRILEPTEPPATSAQSRRCLEDRTNLTDR